MAAWYCIYMNTKWCANPECGEEFASTETSNDFCSFPCEDRAGELEDEDY